jgi:hypothetical protein
MPAGDKGLFMRLVKRVWTEIKAYAASAVNFYNAFDAHPGEQKFSENLRAISKWLLEFIRNIAVVSAIKFFATRADSIALHVVAEVGAFAVAATLATYVTPYRFTGWDAIRNPTLRNTLNLLYTIFPSYVAWFFISRFTDTVVREIVRSQMMH